MGSDVMPAYVRGVRTGGILRCCLQTIRTTAADTRDGDILQCVYSSAPDHRMIVADDGVWEWVG